MTDVQIYSGTLLATADPRVYSARLVPFREQCSTNLGRFSVDPGVFEIPTDQTGFAFNVDHERELVSGALFATREQDDGIWTDLRFAKTKQGDAALEDVRSGRRRAISVEAADVVIRAGKAIAGRIFGAALVKEGGFPSATLLAEAADTAGDTAEDISSSDLTDDETDETTNTPAEQPLEEDTATSAAAADEATSPAEPDDNEEATVSGTATVPSTLTAQAATGKKKNPQLGAADVFDMITRVMKGEDTGGTLLAALTDIKISGGGQLPTGGTAVQPAWLGEVFQKKAYQRRYIPLIRHGKIEAIDEKGFAISTGGEPVQAWNGNKAELPSSSGTTSALSSVFQRWAVANDIAREFYDIPAGRPVVEAYVRLLVNSYARVADYWTLEQLVASAGAQVDVDEIPDGYNPALGKVIQAIDLVDDTDAEPTFVVVAADVWRDLRYTPKDQIPEYVTFSLRRTEGEADGGVVVLKDKAGKLGEGQVLGGGTEAAHVNEIDGETPIQLDALDIAHGGIDKAVIGYTQYMADYADALVLVGDPEVES